MSEQPKFSDTLKDLNKAVLATAVLFENMDYANLPVLLKEFEKLHVIRQNLKDQYEVINSIYEKLSYEKIPAAFEANGFDSVKSGGKNFILSVRINASIPQEHKDEAFKWVKDDAKIPELIVPSINPKSLSSFVKSYFEANAMWPPEEAIKVHKQKYTSIRKA